MGQMRWADRQEDLEVHLDFIKGLRTAAQGPLENADSGQYKPSQAPVPKFSALVQVLFALAPSFF